MHDAGVRVAFAFVPDGTPEPVEWLRRYPDAVRMRARMVCPRTLRLEQSQPATERGGTGEAGTQLYLVRDVGTANSVPLTDRDGRTVTGADGSVIMRPAGWPPEFFVDRGRALLRHSPEYIVSQLVLDLAKFQQNGTWDMQRRDGVFTREWVNYATVVIGLYGAAAGLPERLLLTIQDKYAWLKSDFGKRRMDLEYPHLPVVNVQNTRLGYMLFETGRIGPSPQPR